MSVNSDSLKESLLEANAEYRQLVNEHQEYESRLSALTEKVVLTEEEQVEETTLKKKKLRLKDRMEAIARQAQSAGAAAG